MVVRFIYDCFIQCFFAGIRIASLFNIKARKWIEGRKNWKNNLFQQLENNPPKPNQPIIWLHASSLGEFEQGKPLLEELSKRGGQPYIVVSFFSPSGYEASKNYTGANYICYLPLDTASNARAFINLLNPNLVLWVKYEYWWHYLFTLNKNKIPILLISAIFQQRQAFFKWYGTLHRKMLNFFAHIFVQTLDSSKLVAALVDEDRVTIAGDTRFDRVLEILANHDLPQHVTSLFNTNRTIVVAGSTWPEDDILLAEMSQNKPDILWVIVPHHVDEVSIGNTETLFKSSDKLSKINSANPAMKSNTLLVDCVGMLSRLYRYATICYIGGGFSATGIHNALEAAVYSKPILFGPRYHEYAEAVGLIEAQGAFSINNATELNALLTKLVNDKAFCDQTGTNAGNFVRANAGASEVIIIYIYKNRLLTKL